MLYLCTSPEALRGIEAMLVSGISVPAWSKEAMLEPSGSEALRHSACVVKEGSRAVGPWGIVLAWCVEVPGLLIYLELK